MTTVFFICLIIIGYVYVGYPLLLRAGVFGTRRNWKRGVARLPVITIIVPAHNEEAAIGAKIENLLASDYPRERMDILVGSDGSSDRTEEIVRRYAGEGVGLVSFPQQHGKSAIQNGLVSLASGDILVFTDADCTFGPQTLQVLIDGFADPGVGLVTGRPSFANAAETSVTENEGIYLRYETWLRREESSRGLLTLASGSLFAMRRELWQPLDTSMGDDFALPLHVATKGFRSILEERAVAVTRLTQDEADSMFRMKMRIIAKDFRALVAYRELLDPARHGTKALALWSHKLLRWLVPYFSISLFSLNVLLLSSPLLRLFWCLQVAFYALACCGLCLRNSVRAPIVTIPASFCIVNAAALMGTLSSALGRSFGLWTPERPTSRRTATLPTPGART
jgi:cellulose synthase/poly-beta-1,6-N-acetylglucosamine synthase-like glycosyltransferase